VRKSNVPGQYTQGDDIEDNFPIIVIAAIVVLIIASPVICFIIK